MLTNIFHACIVYFLACYLFFLYLCYFYYFSLFFFFFNDPPPTEISPLPLHDALPIYRALGPLPAHARRRPAHDRPLHRPPAAPGGPARAGGGLPAAAGDHGGQRDHLDRHGLLRSEEHTSELQSRSDLVCRLLLEKKKK